MNEKEIASLYRSLMNSRDDFTRKRSRMHERLSEPRLTPRERDIRECMRNR